ncbi:hypothetical protein K504DRAFT_532311 [Pleomassaria siparia CBS 279.74]|uniref:SnoaL-like domain-containing protein n=1 Tax=Pleomassaria siparia CBS 279.74 TaxID=1314801 RepID=A0A6G1KG65_9PLEO|nr:hypothetical protein K504DRAFT_532311 [Pleomassaria siparia CBS 279.74]
MSTTTTTTTTTTTAPLTKEQVSAIFHLLTSHETADKFFDYLTDDVSWTMTGTAHPQALHLTSKSEVLANMARSASLFQVPHKLQIVNVLIVQGERTAVVEFEGSGGKLKTGKDYKNQYLYIVGFNEQGQIENMKGYMDTGMVRDAFEGSGLW